MLVPFLCLFPPWWKNEWVNSELILLYCQLVFLVPRPRGRTCLQSLNFYILCSGILRMGFPGGASGKEPTCQCRRHRRCESDPWFRKVPGGGRGNPPSILAWRIPRTEEPGGQQSIESQSLASLKQLNMCAENTSGLLIWKLYSWEGKGPSFV